MNLSENTSLIIYSRLQKSDHCKKEIMFLYNEEVFQLTHLYSFLVTQIILKFVPLDLNAVFFSHFWFCSQYIKTS